MLLSLKKCLCSFWLFTLLTCHFVYAQRDFDPMVRVIIRPDHQDWVYGTGENVHLTITVMRFGIALKDTRCATRWALKG